MSHVTRILDRVQQGEARAAEELLPLVYAEFRRLAAHQMALQPAGQTLQPTALLREAWPRLVHEPAPQRRPCSPPTLVTSARATQNGTASLWPLDDSGRPVLVEGHRASIIDMDTVSH